MCGCCRYTKKESLKIVFLYVRIAILLVYVVISSSKLLEKGACAIFSLMVRLMVFDPLLSSKHVRMKISEHYDYEFIVLLVSLLLLNNSLTFAKYLKSDRMNLFNFESISSAVNWKPYLWSRVENFFFEVWHTSHFKWGSWWERELERNKLW